MAQDVSLKAKERTVTKKALVGLREQGIIPGVVYGQGKEATMVEVDARELEKIYNQAGTNRLIDLEIEGQDKPLNTLFVDVQHDPVLGDITHFDLYTVKMDEEIETEIPVHYEGNAPAAYNLDGVLVKNLETIEVRALPNKLPESFTIDLEKLEEINDAVHVEDLDIPEGVELLTDPEEMIVKVDPPRSEEEIAELEEEIEEDAEEAVASEHGGEEEDEEGEGAESEEESDSDSEEQGQ